MISREDVAKREHEIRCMAYEHTHHRGWYDDSLWGALSQDHQDSHLEYADAILALIQPEVPVQRDERAEKLGERLDAMVAEVNASNRIIHQLEERVWRLEAEVAVDDTLLAERQRILDAVPCPDHGPCVPHVLEWIEKARNAEALAANLKRLENAGAIELMRVKRELAVVKAALATRRRK